MNGNVMLERSLLIEKRAGETVRLQRQSQRAGRLSENFSTLVQLNGDNDFTGGIEINVGGALTSTFIAGSDTAFGSGTVWFANAGTIAGANGRERWRTRSPSSAM